MTDFIKALECDNFLGIEKFPKSDLHNHALLGMRRNILEDFTGTKIEAAPLIMYKFSEFESYLERIIPFKLFAQKGFIEHMLFATFQQAVSDHIDNLQISIDTRLLAYFEGNIDKMVQTIDFIQKKIAPEVRFLPQIGIDRTLNFTETYKAANIMLDSGFFRSIDLYGDELFDDNKRFVPLFRKAGNLNMLLCAHSGEFGTSDMVMQTVEMFELNQVQHGIAAAQSVKTMQWLADNNIVLNICPSSNVRLGRVDSIQNHPIRKLFDNGVKVTINTDDLLVFDSSVSEEFLKLFKYKVFSAEELEQIRIIGLSIK